MTFEEKLEAHAAAERRRQYREEQPVREQIRDAMAERLSHISPAIPVRFTEDFLDGKPGEK